MVRLSDPRSGVDRLISCLRQDVRQAPNLAYSSQDRRRSEAGESNESRREVLFAYAERDRRVARPDSETRCRRQERSFPDRSGLHQFGCHTAALKILSRRIDRHAALALEQRFRGYGGERWDCQGDAAGTDTLRRRLHQRAAAIEVGHIAQSSTLCAVQFLPGSVRHGRQGLGRCGRFMCRCCRPADGTGQHSKRSQKSLPGPATVTRRLRTRNQRH